MGIWTGKNLMPKAMREALEREIPPDHERCEAAGRFHRCVSEWRHERSTPYGRLKLCTEHFRAHAVKPWSGHRR